MIEKKLKSNFQKLICIILLIFIIVSFAACDNISDLFVNDEVYSFSTTNSASLGIVNRKIPEEFDGGLTEYPKYANNINFTEEEKQAITAENDRIFDYDSMDADGNLFKNGQPAEISKLKKHTSSNGMYLEDIADSAPAVSKRIRITPAKYGNNMTGLYAPPGEVVKIIIDEKDVRRNMRVNIGQCGQRQDSINIPVGKRFSRMPKIKKNMTLKSVENYIGSPLGGAIYIMNEGDGLEPYEITVVGAVEMPHYLLSSTTDAEWERLRKAPGPMFDLETYGGVRLTMPAVFARGLSAAEMRRIAEFWDKSAQLANKVSAGGWYQTHPVTLIYDTYVPAGAAVAFVGRDLCVLPTGWASNALNYKSIVTSGQWGNLHEMNHHHQGWGAGNNGEVTNNVINAMIYCHDTNIASSRTENGGLSGWNWVTSAYSSLKKTLTQYDAGKKNRDLSMYVDLLHAFGIDKMITMANNSRANNEDAWYKAVCDATGYDMTYFLGDICGFDLKNESVEEIKERNLPVFVPIANLYQSARDVIVGGGKTETEMGKPFYIPFGEPKELDLISYTAAPADISYDIVNVTAPKYGKLVQSTDEDGNLLNGKYTYIPKKGSSAEDAFYVTYSLRHNESKFKIDNITIKISLMQDGSGVQGNIWNNPGWSDLDSAVEDGLENAEPIEKVSYNYAGTADSRQHTITVVEGKIAVPISGSYEFFIKGDDSVRLYTGLNKDKLSLSAYLDTKTPTYSRETEGSFFTQKMEIGKPLYFKLYVKNDNGKGFSGIGFADVSQSEGASPINEGEGGIASETKIPITDLPASYVYRKEADVTVPGRDAFESDRTYSRLLKASGVKYLKTDGMSAASPTAMYDNRDNMSNITDGSEDTFCHTKPGAMPAEFVFDLKSAQSFNTVSLTFIKNSNRGRIKDYTLYFALSPLEFESQSHSVTGTFQNSYKVNAVFETVTARYIKLVASSAYDSNGQKYVAISTVKFGEGITDADIAPQSGSDIKYKGKWQTDSFGTFLNGTAFTTASGSMEVNFHGTDFALFAKKGKAYSYAEVRLDGGDWEKVDFYNDNDEYNQAVYVAAGLDNGYHRIELRAKGLINVDYLAIKPTVPPQPKKMPVVWRVLIIMAVLAACAGIGAGAYYVTKYFKEKDVEDCASNDGERKHGKSTASDMSAENSNETSINKANKDKRKLPYASTTDDISAQSSKLAETDNKSGAESVKNKKAKAKSAIAKQSAAKEVDVKPTIKEKTNSDVNKSSKSVTGKTDNAKKKIK